MVTAPRVACDGAFVVRAFAGGTGRANAASIALNIGPGMTEACRYRYLVRAQDALPALRFG